MRVKEESEKAGLNSSLKKLRSWHPVASLVANRREKLEAVTNFLFLGSKIIVDGNCNHEIRS